MLHSGVAVIFNSDTGKLTITNSTLSNNIASGSDIFLPSGWGGGILSVNQITVANSTFSNNSAPAPMSVGGGIFIHGSGTIINSTLSGNSAGDGAGILIDADASLTLSNTIVANSHYSSGGHDCALYNTSPTGTNNLIEDGSCLASLSGDPQLGPLADNGGPTQTFALLAGSPAIDAGDDPTCAGSPINNLDQRGVSRPQGTHCDIGAYEYLASSPTNTPMDTATGTSTDVPTDTFTPTDIPTTHQPRPTLLPLLQLYQIRLHPL